MNLMKRNAAMETSPRFFDSFLMKDLFDVPAIANKSMVQVPAVNVTATEDALVVEMAAPGLKREQLHIELDSEVLTIAYREESNKEEANDKGNYIVREFSSRSFTRKFTLPDGVVEEEKISATYKDGILRLELPKREEAKPKPPREIKLS